MLFMSLFMLFIPTYIIHLLNLIYLLIVELIIILILCLTKKNRFNKSFIIYALPFNSEF